MTVSARQDEPMRAVRARRCLHTAAVDASARAAHPRARIAGGVAMRWMRGGAPRGMVGTDGPGNRYKDSSRNTHG
jgi:hypothetical protein